MKFKFLYLTIGENRKVRFTKVGEKNLRYLRHPRFRLGPCSETPGHISTLSSDPTHREIKLQLHDTIYRLRFYSNSLIHILSLSNSHNNVESIQKNRGDKSHRVIIA